MKKWSKRIVCIWLAAIMIFGLAACGGDSGETSTNKEDAKKNVYRMQDLDVDLWNENQSVQDVYYSNGRIYFLINESRWDEMIGTAVNLVSIKEDGSDIQNVELINTLRENPDYIPYDEDEDGYIMPRGVVGSAGSITNLSATMDVAVPEVEVPEEDPDSQGDVPEDDNTEEGEFPINTDFYIQNTLLNASGVYIITEKRSYHYDDAGNYITDEFAMELNAYGLDGEEHYKLMLNNDPDSYVYYNNMSGDNDGNIALTGDQIIYLYDASGAPVSEVDTSDLGYVDFAFIGDGGKLYIVAYNNEWTKIYLKQYNIQTKQFEADIDIPDVMRDHSMKVGSQYDILLTGQTGLSGYNIGDTDITPIMNYINSDIDGGNMYNIYEMGENKLLGIYNDEETWIQHVALLTYVDPADIVDKEVLTYGCFYLNYDVRKDIIRFNKENELYRITVKDYSEYSTMEDYSAGYTQLNNDILAGQVPDILQVNQYSIPMDSYIAKGVFADIGKMLDEDEELNRDDYMTNVFEAYSVNGKLYSVIPNFNVSTVMAKTSLVGDTPGITMEEVNAIINDNPGMRAFSETMTRDNMISQLLMYSGSRFVDKETGKCNFDSPEFIEMLEFAAQFPAEYDWDNMNYRDDYASQFRNNKCLLMEQGIYEFSEYAYVTQVYFGEPVTLIGFPSDDGLGAVINANIQYAISAKSKNKEGAWQFLRYYLTEEYQMNDEYLRYSYTLPIYKEALLLQLERAQERPYWEDENGVKEYYDRTAWINNEDVVLNPITKEEADMLYNYVSSVNQQYYYDDNLYVIITEEAAAFFEGQKGAAEVAEIIQSRAKIYISESR